MNTHRILPLTLVALAVLAGCSSLTADNALLIEARSDYRNALADPQTSALAPVELKAAADALGRADQAFSHKDSASDVSHLAYVAKQRVAIAQETTRHFSGRTVKLLYKQPIRQSGWLTDIDVFETITI